MLANFTLLRFCKCGWAANRFSFRLCSRNPRLRSLDQQVAFKLGNSIQYLHRHSTGSAG
ncbi:hypothetical protein BUH_4223 [Burkholderia pseudomallei Pakistan 9]|nr:hypothetical protein BUH_4223 [Burkholderia pseudomallei Pakistan 9]